MDEKIEVLLKEYDTLRAEILTAMASRHSIVTFGLATVGALWSAAAVLVAASSANQNLAYLLLIIVVPLVSLFIIEMWLGEYGRMYRAGRFIAEHSEPEINKLLGAHVLTWESRLRDNKKHMRSPYYATVILFVLSSLVSCAFGFCQILDHSKVCLILSVSFIILSVHVGEGVYFYSKLNKLRLE